MKQTQNERIMQHLMEGRRLTALMALKLFGTIRLAARIYDIRKMLPSGYEIVTRPMHILTDGDRTVTVTEYRVQKI